VVAPVLATGRPIAVTAEARVEQFGVTRG